MRNLGEILSERESIAQEMQVNIHVLESEILRISIRKKTKIFIVNEHLKKKNIYQMNI